MHSHQPLPNPRTASASPSAIDSSRLYFSQLPPANHRKTARQQDQRAQRGRRINLRRSHGLVGLSLSANYAGKDMASLLRHAVLLSRGAGALAIGSDFNGVISTIPGAAGPSDYAAVLKELRSAEIPADHSAEAFVDLWRRTRAVSRGGY